MSVTVKKPINNKELLKHLKNYSNMIPLQIIEQVEQVEPVEAIIIVKAGRGRPRKEKEIKTPAPRGRKPLSDEERLQHAKDKLPAMKINSANWYIENKESHLEYMRKKYREKVEAKRALIINEIVIEQEDEINA
jgi:hypothetical protein